MKIKRRKRINKITKITETIVLHAIKRFGAGALIVILLLFSNASLHAQCETNNVAFKSGELIVYDLLFNWKFIWTKAGSASLSTNAITYNSKSAYKINLLAIGSKGADFFFKMRDTLTCVIGDRLQPYYFRKGSEEGKRYVVDEAHFSYRNGVSYVKQKRIKKDGEIIFSEQDDSRCIYDMLSILAQARAFDPADYKVGQHIKFSMATGLKVEEQTLIYRGKKNFKAEDDTIYRCLVFSLVEYKKGKEKEIITFYVTDDKNHIPVRLDLFLNFGSAKAFLRNVRNYKYPMTSVIRK